MTVCLCVCVCVRAQACVCSISQLSSWPPYAELGAQAGSICQVNAQPRPPTPAAGPYKLHYSRRNRAGTHSRTQPTHTNLCSDRLSQSGEARCVTQWQSHQSLGRYFRNSSRLNWYEMNAGCMNSFFFLFFFPQYSTEQLGKVSISSEVKWGEGSREGHRSSGCFYQAHHAYDYVMPAITTLAFLFTL